MRYINLLLTLTLTFDICQTYIVKTQKAVSAFTGQSLQYADDGYMDHKYKTVYVCLCCDGLLLNISGGFSMGGALALHFAYRYCTDLAGVFALSSFLGEKSSVYEVTGFSTFC